MWSTSVQLLSFLFAVSPGMAQRRSTPHLPGAYLPGQWWFGFLGSPRGCPSGPEFVALHNSRAEIDRLRLVVSFPRGRGRISMHGGRAIIVARCPLCGEEHRYEKGEASGEELELIRRRGYTEEWLPCQKDLPGNFWRILISSSRQGSRPDSARRTRNTKPR